MVELAIFFKFLIKEQHIVEKKMNISLELEDYTFI